MKNLNNEEMAMRQSGWNWSALTSDDCKKCGKGIFDYCLALASAGIAAPATGGLSAIAFWAGTTLYQGYCGASEITTYCPPCYQKLTAE